MTMHRTGATHILIAEDNPGDVRLIRLALEETPDWNVTVSVARDGAQAIELLESSLVDAGDPHKRPDLVILDFNLPKRSGTEVLKTIRHSQGLCRLPVVVLSSSPEYFLREKMRDAKVEANCYLTKPSDFDEFVRIGGHIRECYRAGLVAGA
jgi:CheY-like chemotaxis protein